MLSFKMCKMLFNKYNLPYKMQPYTRQTVFSFVNTIVLSVCNIQF